MQKKKWPIFFFSGDYGLRRSVIQKHFQTKSATSIVACVENVLLLTPPFADFSWIGLGQPWIVTLDGFNTSSICFPAPASYPTKVGTSQTPYSNDTCFFRPSHLLYSCLFFLFLSGRNSHPRSRSRCFSFLPTTVSVLVCITRTFQPVDPLSIFIEFAHRIG